MVPNVSTYSTFTYTSQQHTALRHLDWLRNGQITWGITSGLSNLIGRPDTLSTVTAGGDASSTPAFVLTQFQTETTWHCGSSIFSSEANGLVIRCAGERDGPRLWPVQAGLLQPAGLRPRGLHPLLLLRGVRGVRKLVLGSLPGEEDKAPKCLNSSTNVSSVWNSRCHKTTRQQLALNSL